MGGKMQRKKGKPKKRLNLAVYLSRNDVKAVTVLALMETLALDMQTYTPADSEAGRILKGMLNLINAQNKTYVGAVEPHMVEFSDRFLCSVQVAFDGFFDEMTDHCRANMESIKEKWGVGMGVDPIQDVTA